MAETHINNLGQLDDNQVEELRNHLRDFVTGVKDPGSSFLDTLIAGHGSHNSVKTPSLPGPVNPPTAV
jgi:hypothetical protein